MGSPNVEGDNPTLSRPFFIYSDLIGDEKSSSSTTTVPGLKSSLTEPPYECPKISLIHSLTPIHLSNLNMLLTTNYSQTTFSPLTIKTINQANMNIKLILLLLSPLPMKIKQRTEFVLHSSTRIIITVSDTNVNQCSIRTKKLTHLSILVLLDNP